MLCIASLTAASPALYDVELAFPYGEPSILSVLEGRSSEVHAHVR